MLTNTDTPRYLKDPKTQSIKGITAVEPLEPMGFCLAGRRRLPQSRITVRYKRDIVRPNAFPVFS
jgi:hypothetical protein